MSEQNTKRPVIFGEVLFDRFPDGRDVLGGAPFNVAWHLQGFGVQPLLVSRVGDDATGCRVKETMCQWSMDGSGLQTDRECPTGAVEVALENGQPSFSILPDQAYDRIDADPALAAIANQRAALLYHGSLAVRDTVSAHALTTLREKLDAPVFVDVNLRDPWWSRDNVAAFLKESRWAKLNDDELATLTGRPMPPDPQLQETAVRFAADFGLELLVITLGERGAFAVRDGAVTATPPVAVAQVADTVGAGDGFSAVTLLGLLQGWPLDITLERAAGFAAALCAQRGATTPDNSLYNGFARAWSDEPAGERTG